MSTDIPVSTIDEQALTTPPFTNTNTIFDDTVVKFDDASALFGGPLTIVEGVQSKIELNTPSSKIDIYR